MRSGSRHLASEAVGDFNDDWQLCIFKSLIQTKLSFLYHVSTVTLCKRTAMKSKWPCFCAVGDTSHTSFSRLTGQKIAGLSIWRMNIFMEPNSLKQLLCIFLYINSIYCRHHHHTSLRHTNNNDTIPGTLLPVQLEHFLIMWMEIFSCVKCRHWTSRHVQRHITDWVECIGLASRPITSHKLKEWLQWLALKKYRW